MVDQSYSERQLFEKAYERILSEFQIILGVSIEDTQKKLDKALKRNLSNNQPPQSKSIATKTASDLPTEEPCELKNQILIIKRLSHVNRYEKRF